MKQVYPVIITENANDYVVYIPDFDINTEAKTIPDAIDMAREAIGLCGISNQEMRRKRYCCACGYRLCTVPRTRR